MYPVNFENEYELIQYIERMIRESSAYNETSIRLGDAHEYVKQYCMPDGLGKNVWHTILDDAIKMRNRIKELTEIK